VKALEEKHVVFQNFNNVLAAVEFHNSQIIGQ
jgi:hypothetical protein